MNIDQQKEKLETAINALIWNFEKDTGVEVSMLDVRKIQDEKRGKGLRFIVILKKKKGKVK